MLMMLIDYVTVINRVIDYQYYNNYFSYCIVIASIINHISQLFSINIYFDIH